jgi:hypothetical protein
MRWACPRSEVKSLARRNEEKQLPLRLGQVLRYWHVISQGGYRCVLYLQQAKESHATLDGKSYAQARTSCLLASDPERGAFVHSSDSKEQRQHEQSQSDASGWGRPEMAQVAAALEGQGALYRIGFRAMLVEGFPDLLHVDGAFLLQTLKPITVQRTRIIQQTGLGLNWWKKTDYMEVGANMPKTLCVLPFSASDNLVEDFGARRDQALSIVGLVAAALDERVAIEELFQDVLLVDFEDDEDEGTPVDASMRVRNFMPRVFLDRENEASDRLEGINEEDDAVVSTAARWYLRGAQLGPTPDAIVYFWVAIEGLVPDAQGKQVVNHVKEALDSAGFDQTALPATVGQLYGLRADIVHKGQDQPSLLYAGYYALEAIVRALMRKTLDIETDWPVWVSENSWPEPTRTMIDKLYSAPKTWWE